MLMTQNEPFAFTRRRNLFLGLSRLAPHRPREPAPSDERGEGRGPFSRATPSSTGTTTCPGRSGRTPTAPRDVEAYDLRAPHPGDTDLARLREGGVGGQFWSVYVPAELPGGFARTQLEQIDIARRVIARYPERLALAATADEVERAMKDGRVASLLGMEGGHAIENSLGALRAYYDLGVALHDAHPHEDARLGRLRDRRRAPRRPHPLRRGGGARDEPARHAGRPLARLAGDDGGRAARHRGAGRSSPTPRRGRCATTRGTCPTPSSRAMKANGGVVMVTFVNAFVSPGVGDGERAAVEGVRGAHPGGRGPRGAAADRAGDRGADAEGPGHDRPGGRPRRPRAQASRAADHVGLGGDYDGNDAWPEGLSRTCRATRACSPSSSAAAGATRTSAGSRAGTSCARCGRRRRSRGGCRRPARPRPRRSSRSTARTSAPRAAFDRGPAAAPPPRALEYSRGPEATVAETTLKTLIDRFRSQARVAARRPRRARRGGAAPAGVGSRAGAGAGPRGRRRARATRGRQAALGARRAGRDRRQPTPTPACARRREAGWSTSRLHEQDEAQARAAVAGLREARQPRERGEGRPARRRPRGRARRARRPEAPRERGARGGRPQDPAAGARPDRGRRHAPGAGAEPRAEGARRGGRRPAGRPRRARRPSPARRRRAGRGTAGPRAARDRGAGLAGDARARRPPRPQHDEEAERRAYEEAREALEREARGGAEASRARTDLVASLEGAEGEAIPAALAGAREEWAGLTPLAGAEGEALEARFAAALDAAGKRHDAYLAGLARRDELAALVQEAEALAEQELEAARAAFTALEAKWREATADARPARPARALCCRRHAHCARAPRRPAPSRPRRTRSTSTCCCGSPLRAEALVAKGTDVSLRDTDHALREIREALAAPRPLPDPQATATPALARLDAARKQLYPLLQQLREDAEWKRWANVTVQEELCAQAEALLAEEDLEKAASALRELDAALEAGQGGPEGQGARPCGRASRPRATQVKARSTPSSRSRPRSTRRTSRRRRPCARRPRRSRTRPTGSRRRRRCARCRPSGRRSAPVPRAVSQRVWERFRKPCDHFFTRWQEHREERSHEWARQPRAEGGPVREGRGARGSRPTGRRPRPSIKQLQAEWRTIGAVKKSRVRRGVAALPRRLRPLLRPLQEPRRARAARPPGRPARRICAELEALAAGGGRGCREPPADLVARVQAAQTAWRQAGRPAPGRDGGARRALLCARATGCSRSSPARVRGQRARPGGEPPASGEARRRASRACSTSPGAEGGAARPQSATDLAARLRDALAVEHDRRPRGASSSAGRGRRSRSRRRRRPGSASARCRGRRARRSSRASSRPAAASSTSARAPSRRAGRGAASRSGARAGPAPRSRPAATAAEGRALTAWRRARGSRATSSSSSCSLPESPALAAPRRLDPRDLPQRARAGAVPAPRRRGRRALAADHPAHERTLAVLDGRGPRGRFPAGTELRDLGRDLFETLLPGDVRRLYDIARSQQKRRRARPRVHLDARLGGRQALGARVRPRRAASSSPPPP